MKKLIKTNIPIGMLRLFLQEKCMTEEVKRLQKNYNMKKIFFDMRNVYLT